MLRITVRAAVLTACATLVAPPAAACPFCEGGGPAGNPVHREVFGPDFWPSLAATAAPFLVLVALNLAARYARDRPGGAR